MELTTLAAAMAAKAGEAGGQIAKDEAAGFLKSLLGPLANSAGELVALSTRERMFNNIVDTLARAKQKCAAAGIDPKEVPLKIIHPLLENAALESEPSLQERWANLLVNAASGEAGYRGVSFSLILKELSPNDVLFLDALVESRLSRIGRIPRLVEGNMLHPLMERLRKQFEPKGIDEVFPDLGQMLDLFCRLGVMRVLSVPQPIQPDDLHQLLAENRRRTPSPIGLSSESEFEITELGWGFIQACQAPKKL